MENAEAPKTIPEIGIYLHFMGKEITELKGAINVMNTNYVPISQYLELKAEVESLKTYRDTVMGKMWGIAATAGLIFGALGWGLTFYFNNFHK